MAGEKGRLNSLFAAEMFGPDAEHSGHLLAWVTRIGLTVDEFLALSFYHPVVEEGLRTALRDAATKRTMAIGVTLRAVWLLNLDRSKRSIEIQQSSPAAV
jgi:hypothetical protein